MFFVFLFNAALAGLGAGLFVYNYMGKKKEKAAYFAGFAVFQLLSTIAMLVNIKL